MPFTKETGSKYGKMGGATKHQRDTEWDALGEYLLNKGAPAVVKLMGRLETEDPKIYLTHFKDILEYFKPKLARTDITSKGEKISAFGLGHAELKKEE